MQRQRVALSGSTRSTSRVPLLEKYRAGTTRVSFSTKRSSARIKSGRSLKRWWVTALVARFNTIMREAARSGSGSLAISSGGRW
jgi:hypothetical protein